MDLRLHFLEAEGPIEPWRPQIESETSTVGDRIDLLVPASDRSFAVDVVVRRREWGIVPELGIGGSCYEASIVTIALDPEMENFEAGMAGGGFAMTLAHELHHALRHKAVGYGMSLGEALVSEGLADHFALEITRRRPVWSEGRPSSATLDRAVPDLASTGYDHPAWFFGTTDIPRWTGYAIGWNLIDRYLERNPGEAASRLAPIPASSVLSEIWPLIREETHSQAAGSDPF